MENKIDFIAKGALNTVAKKEGVSSERIRKDIEAAIAAARKDGNPTVQAFWNAVPRQGDAPTPEELIAYIAGTLKMKLKL